MTIRLVTNTREAVVDDCEAVTAWTVLGNDTDNLATTVNHAWGTKAMEFDKVDGAAGTVYAGAYRTVDLNLEAMSPHDYLCLHVYLSDLTDVAAVQVRLGTDASHHQVYDVADTALVAGWNSLAIPLGNPTSVAGNGWNNANVDYLAVAIKFDAEDDTLADIAVDHITLKSGPLVRDLD